MREVLMPDAAIGDSTSNCQSACGRSASKVLFGVKSNSFGGGAWPGRNAPLQAPTRTLAARASAASNIRVIRFSLFHRDAAMGVA